MYSGPWFSYEVPIIGKAELSPIRLSIPLEHTANNRSCSLKRFIDIKLSADSEVAKYKQRNWARCSSFKNASLNLLEGGTGSTNLQKKIQDRYAQLLINRVFDMIVNSNITRCLYRHKRTMKSMVFSINDQVHICCHMLFTSGLSHRIF